DNSKEYRCTEYKILNKCIIFIILNDMKDILKYVGLYNHYEKEFDAFINDYKNIKLKMNIEKVYFYRVSNHNV
ncbi:hypothetical protein H8356DRAFT_946692, partial [Neocallimastix lanati (nom. inval.)]